MEKKRDFSIDILKFFAAFVITWSHFEKPLGDYSFLATGGAFGDTLFFFASGYTLLLSNKNMNFFNWYKRRINRIYPTVFAWALIAVTLFEENSNLVEILLYGGGFFVSCIMVFYFFFYPIKKYLCSYMGGVIIVYYIVFMVSYYFIDHKDVDLDYKWMWSAYFIAMLLGAIIGKNRSINAKVLLFRNPILSLFGLFVSAVVYYTLMYSERTIPVLSLFNIIPLIGFTYFLYSLCNTNFCKKLYSNKYAHASIMTIGGLCLEIYIVQPSLLTDKMNSIFPLNLLVIFAIIILFAYLLKCLSRLWTQTFKDEDYNWKDIIKAY